MFFLVMLFGLLLMHYIVMGWFFINLPLQLNFFYKILPAIFTILFFFSMNFGRRFNIEWLEYLAVCWIGILFIWFTFIFLIMLVQIICSHFFNIHFSQKIIYIALFLCITMSCISFYTASQKPIVKHLEISAPQLNKDVKLALITDTHFGLTVPLKRAESLVNILQKENPSLIFFVGDIFENIPPESESYSKILSKLKTDLGSFAVFGNHEYYRGLANAKISFDKANIKLLQNESIVLDNLNIIGINDIKAGRITEEDFTKILVKQVKSDKYNLLLSHTPLYFDLAETNGVNLMLSGHTHRGQIWPFEYFTRITTPYVYGLYSINNAKIYVNSGTYFWGPPLRLFTKNELAIITLKGKNND